MAKQESIPQFVPSTAWEPREVRVGETTHTLQQRKQPPQATGKQRFPTLENKNMSIFDSGWYPQSFLHSDDKLNDSVSEGASDQWWRHLHVQPLPSPFPINHCALWMAEDMRSLCTGSSVTRHSSRSQPSPQLSPCWELPQLLSF